MKEKTCTNCHKTLPIEEFGNNRQNSGQSGGGYNNKCRTCHNEYRNDLYKLNKEIGKSSDTGDITEKKCSKCDRILAIEFFSPRGDGGYNTWCKPCYNEYKKAWTKNPEDFARNSTKPKIFPDERECVNCGQLLPITEFGYSSKGRGTYSNLCKPCYNAKARKVHKIHVNNGICRECNRPIYGNQLVCLEHWFRQMIQGALGRSDKNTVQILKDRLAQQDFKCFFTGRSILPGENASLDHYLPRSRYPELSRDINNIVWTDFKVNLSKRDQTPEEFIEQSRLVVEYQKPKISDTLKITDDNTKSS